MRLLAGAFVFLRFDRAKPVSESLKGASGTANGAESRRAKPVSESPEGASGTANGAECGRAKPICGTAISLFFEVKHGFI